MSFQESVKENRDHNNINHSLIKNANNSLKQQDEGFLNEVQNLFSEIQKNMNQQNYGDSLNVEESNAVIQENERLVKNIKMILQQEIARDKKNQNKGQILQCEKQLQMIQKKINASKIKLQELIKQQQYDFESDLDEENGFIGQNQVMSDMDFTLYDDTIQARKERMQNAHRQMRAVHSIYQQIDNITAKQSSQLTIIDGNVDNTLTNAKDTNKELIRAKDVLDSKSKSNSNMLLLLAVFFILMILFVKYY